MRPGDISEFEYLEYRSKAWPKAANRKVLSYYIARCVTRRSVARRYQIARFHRKQYHQFRLDLGTYPVRRIFSGLFHRHGFRQIARLVDVGAHGDGHVVGDQLHWYGKNQRRHGRGHRRQCQCRDR